MDDRPDEHAGRAVAWVCGFVATVLFVGGALYFLQTRDVTVFIVAVTAALALALAQWVFRDAGRRGVARWPWFVAVLVAPALGFVVYLGVRDLAARLSGRA